MKINQLKPKIPIYNHLFFILVTFIYWFSMYIYVPIFVPYIYHLGGTAALAGLIVGSYGIMQILLRFPIGVLSDKWQIRKPFMILGLATAVISCLGFVLSESLAFALVSRVISGITASTWVAFTVLYASYFKKEESTKAMGNIQCITVLAQLTSMGLSGYLIGKWGWKAPFYFGAFIGIIGFTMSFWIKESNKKELIKQNIQIHEVVKHPLILKASLLSALAHSVLFITMFGFSTNQALNIGATKESLIVLVFSFMIPHALAPIVTGQYLLTRFNRWHVLFAGFLGTAVFSMVIPLVTDLTVLYVTQIFNGFALGMLIPLLMGMAIQEIPNKNYATAMGFFQSCYALGIFFGPFIAGKFTQSNGLETVFFIAGFLGLTGTVLSLVWYKLETVNRYQKELESKPLKYKSYKE
ncbi:MFS transporter [Neobacillus mesonae]|uniref:MFS transporter n=1 Tax=Neobacillus mesonae TaxID=1193713 RepID=UPI00204129C3|nr:MFS transporter [Neobacillus mesonae]MCM3569888.1 MFS transporter [Neobacillus mesonae]